MSSCYAYYAFVSIVIINAAVHDDIPQCGLTAIYKNRQSVIQSPNYPSDYPPNTCWDYVIRSPYRCPTKFHLQFLDFSLEVSENCTHDYLAIGVSNDGDDMDILCGQFIGIKKYHTLDGILRLRFYADDSPWTTNKGFKILVTRLACEKADALRVIYNDTEQVVLPPSYLRSSYANGENSFQNLSLQEQYQALPAIPTNQVYNPSQPLCPQNWIIGALNNQPLPTNEPWQSRANLVKSTQEQNQNNIATCCLTAFKQQRFYLSSPGFPRTVITSLLPSERRDCHFQLEKFSTKVCRLRILFKFFDFGQPFAAETVSPGNSNGCAEDFLEIDGLRYCGCRSGHSVLLSWEFTQDKMIQMRMGFSGLPSNGFLLDITQEECSATNTVNAGNQPVNGLYNNLPQRPYYVPPQQAIYAPPMYFGNPYAYNPYTMGQVWPLTNVQPQLQYPQYRLPRTTDANPLKVVETNSTSKEFYYTGREVQNQVQARSSEQNEPLYLRDANRCVFGTSEIFKLLIDPLWLRKPTCYAPQANNFLGNVFG